MQGRRADLWVCGVETMTDYRRGEPVHGRIYTDVRSQTRNVTYGTSHKSMDASQYLCSLNGLVNLLGDLTLPLAEHQQEDQKEKRRDDVSPDLWKWKAQGKSCRLGLIIEGRRVARAGLQ